MVSVNNFKKLIPAQFKQIIKNIFFRIKYGFPPPPSFTDLSDYEILLDTIIEQKIYQLDGDFVEVEAFLGGGTYKLAKLLEKLKVNKKVYAVDIFNVDFDQSVCTQGITMSEIYRRILKGRNQYEIYREITKKCKNIVTIIGDSKEIVLPCEKIAFGYIDGNHHPEYVRNDFYLIWPKLVSKGIVGFDDYGYDLPQVTTTIHQLIGEEKDRILKIWTAGLKTIFIQKNEKKNFNYRSRYYRTYFGRKIRIKRK